MNYTEVFAQLGYQVKPEKEFGFVKRNIHFATACSAKERLSPDLLEATGKLIPDEVVRI